jgi:hydrogenase expression/formation protein HypE
VNEVFLSRLDNPYLRTLDDSAILPLEAGRLAMTTDCYVVTPIFFPGGSIGSLSVHGTVNDLAMQGATPLFLTLGLIIEEGLPLQDLFAIVDGVAEASREANVSVVAGDTKVVPRGQADQVFITTAGIGLIPANIDVSSCNARPGDHIIINGTIGDHGVAILSQREGLHFKTPVLSDAAPLSSLVSSLLTVTLDLHVLRDPTRGGVATALNEIAQASGVAIELHEDHLPFAKSVSAACDILGLDPLYMPNEGKCIVIASEKDCQRILPVMKKHRYGKDAAIIGQVKKARPGQVLLKTKVGGTRILSMLTGEQLPRIC